MIILLNPGLRLDGNIWFDHLSFARLIIERSWLVVDLTISVTDT